MELENYLVEFAQALELGRPNSDYTSYIEILEHCMTNQIALLCGIQQDEAYKFAIDNVKTAIKTANNEMQALEKNSYKVVPMALNILHTRLSTFVFNEMLFNRVLLTYDGLLHFCISDF